MQELKKPFEVAKSVQKLLSRNTPFTLHVSRYSPVTQASPHATFDRKLSQDMEDELDAFFADIEETAHSTTTEDPPKKPTVQEAVIASSEALKTSHNAETSKDQLRKGKTVYELSNAKLLDYDRDGRLLGYKAQNDLIIEAVDHESIMYPSFRRCFYFPSIPTNSTQCLQVSSDVDVNINISNTKLKQDTNAVRKLMEPIEDFNVFRKLKLGASVDDSVAEDIGVRLLNGLQHFGIDSPTAIQRHCLPIMLQGYDSVSVAETGSGKTLCYILPSIIHVIDQGKLEASEGPIVLIIVPTRELAQQIAREARKYATIFKLKVCEVIGGANKYEQVKELRKLCEIVVATPGRLIDLITESNICMKRVTYFVLDEADQLVSMGFEKQIRTVSNQIRPNRQTLLFSATMNEHLRFVARDLFPSYTTGFMGDAPPSATFAPVATNIVSQSLPFLLLQTTHALERSQSKMSVHTSSMQQKEFAKLKATNLLSSLLQKSSFADAEKVKERNDSSQSQKITRDDLLKAEEGCRTTIVELTVSFPSEGVTSATKSKGVKLVMNKTIVQKFVSMLNNDFKLNWLKLNLRRFMNKGKVLIFVNKKATTESLTQKLVKDLGFKADSLHGGKFQHYRDEVIAKFKRTDTSRKQTEKEQDLTTVLNVLVATDVAARGLDVPLLKTVINYDCPRNLEQYIHRIGRTGRKGQEVDASSASDNSKGKSQSYSLVLASDHKFCNELARWFKKNEEAEKLPRFIQDIALQKAVSYNTVTADTLSSSTKSATRQVRTKQRMIRGSGRSDVFLASESTVGLGYSSRTAKVASKFLKRLQKETFDLHLYSSFVKSAEVLNKVTAFETEAEKQTTLFLVDKQEGPVSKSLVSLEERKSIELTIRLEENLHKQEALRYEVERSLALSKEKDKKRNARSKSSSESIGSHTSRRRHRRHRRKHKRSSRSRRKSSRSHRHRSRRRRRGSSSSSSPSTVSSSSSRSARSAGNPGSCSSSRSNLSTGQKQRKRVFSSSEQVHTRPSRKSRWDDKPG